MFIYNKIKLDKILPFKILVTKKNKELYMHISDPVEIINKIVNNPETLKKALLKPNAFSQKQILTFKTVMSIMLDFCDDSLQTKITRHLKAHDKLRTATKQALSKALSQIDESPFVTMSNALVDYVYNSGFQLKTFKNYFLFAVDGSYFNIPRTLENLNYFDKDGKSTNLKLGGSMVYDVLNNVPIDFAISKTFMNERLEFSQQLARINTNYPHVVKQAIFTLDRGYRSLEIMTDLSLQNINFVSRASTSFLKEIDEAPMGDNIITCRNGLRIRVIKFRLDTDEIFILCTNLFHFSEDELKEIYRFRWIIETSFNTAKNKLFVDKNQGKTVNFLQQSYWATMVKMVFLGIAQNECDWRIECEEEEKRRRKKGRKPGNKHCYKANTRTLIQLFDAYYILAGFAMKCWNSIFRFMKIINEGVRRKVRKYITNSKNIVYVTFDEVNSYAKS